MNNYNNNVNELEETLDPEKHNIPDKWIATLIVGQVILIGVLLLLISSTYINNNEVLWVLFFGAIPFVTGGILFHSWKQAKTDTSRKVFKINLIFLVIAIIAIILLLLAIVVGLHVIHESLKDYSGGNPWL